MGVYIKGMEMPESCESCRFHGLGGITLNETVCVFTGNHRQFPNMPRFLDCPLIPVPPHGRLIDADAFELLECNGCDGACEIIECDCTKCNAECRCDFMLDIHAAPTIIPAEEVKEL